MTTAKQVLRLAGLIARERRARIEISVIEKHMRPFIGAWHSSSVGTCADGKEGVTIEVLLGSYLTMFPSAVPRVDKWESSSRGDLECMAYPAQYLGIVSGVHSWVTARTAWVVIKEPVEKVLEAVAEVALEVAS